MADVTSAAANSAVAGIGAVTVAVLGLPPGVLFCGFIGAGFGVTITETPSKLGTLWAFLFSMFAGAYAGAWLAPKLGGDVIAANMAALVLATVALQGQAILAGRLAPLIDNLLERFGAKRS